ncbi:TIGR03084 family protein (plasmid) [Rhodococcus sp. USK10]|uniref:TIGR03084 family metal-binding protein n=1 Tax=Rhodococcus sp. USK10 TaxID=2789739 RepID=UPI001C5F41C5|nr:TIGR03084 family metal-binding protein [Rhodococcus sp. USK10]QYB00132.1 TIGR03084 family protein [Rhodococcus sp. USK10]
MTLDYPALLEELKVESDGIIGVLRDLAEQDWDRGTPAIGWSIRDQVSHLAYFDETATAAIREPERFIEEAAALTAGGTDFPDRIAAESRSMPAGELFDWFVRVRGELLAVLAETEPRTRAPWYGPDMSAASSATARLMETWAHGQDVYDTLAVPHPPSIGLRSIAHLGVSTFSFVHRLNDREVPTQPVRVELRAPDGESVWTWGPEDAANVVSGPAEDFVIVVTQRRHISDTALTVTGSVAASWMSIAQAFANVPGPGRAPLTTTGRHS